MKFPLDRTLESPRQIPILRMMMVMSFSANRNCRRNIFRGVLLPSKQMINDTGGTAEIENGGRQKIIGHEIV